MNITIFIFYTSSWSDDFEDVIVTCPCWRDSPHRPHSCSPHEATKFPTSDQSHPACSWWRELCWGILSTNQRLVLLFQPIRIEYYTPVAGSWSRRAGWTSSNLTKLSVTSVSVWTSLLLLIRVTMFSNKSWQELFYKKLLSTIQWLVTSMNCFGFLRTQPGLATNNLRYTPLTTIYKQLIWNNLCLKYYFSHLSWYILQW